MADVRRTCGILALALSMASTAHANYVNGKIYCDANFTRLLDAGDTPLNGVTATATSLTALPGQVLTDVSGDAVPVSPAVPGFYQVHLPPRLEDWRVELLGPGLPLGATIILPATGFYQAHINPNSTVTDHVIGLDFLVDCNPPPLCTNASCDDHNPCTDDHCDPHVGCSYTNNTAACEDGNACTTNDVCSGGQCQSGAAKVCDDGKVCTTDTCDATLGCVFTNNTAPCDDGDACTTDDVCADGECQGGPPKVCDDGRVCTTDTCDATLGCVFTNNTAPCEDGNACTTNDVCADGQCQGGPAKSCDDGNPCNGIEICVPETGCQPGPPPYLVKTEGRFGNLAVINADIGANDAGALLRMGRNAKMPDGTDATGDMMSLGNGTSIYQAFTDKLNKGAGAVVRFSTGPATLPIEQPYCVIPTLTCGGPDVMVPAAGSGPSLPPGSYGRLVMGTGSTLVLEGGEYHFCSFRTARAATITVQGGTPSTIDVLGNLLLADQGTLELGSGTPLPIVRVGGGAIRFGAAADVRLILLAPAARLSLGRAAHVTGSFCVASAGTDKHIRLDCPPLPPTP